jgi:Core-2/I-Branching enzyme
MTMKCTAILLTHDEATTTSVLLNWCSSNSVGVVCHHDFSKCATPSFASLLREDELVRPSLVTAYARFSVCDALVLAIRKLFDSKTKSPDWFYVLSGRHYPIKPIKQMMREVEEANADAWIDWRSIDSPQAAVAWDRECFRRYCTKSVKVPWISKKLKPTHRRYNLTSPPLGWPLFPFTKSLKCYAGSNWFAGNAKAAKVILDGYDKYKHLRRHYEKVWCPDESYFQTLLKADGSLKIHNAFTTFVHWGKEDDQHPTTLGLEHVDQLRERQEHFARKFEFEEGSELHLALRKMSE